MSKYKHTVSYESERQAQSIARRLTKLMCIACNVSADGEGYFDVTWQTEEALSSVQRGLIIRVYQPDGIQFNALAEEEVAMNKQQEQFNQDYEAKKVIAYWVSEYGQAPDSWELAKELEISEKEAEKSLARIAKEQAK